ncbi:UPF0545 protein C22orf39 homolog isoform X2 [Solea solea]|uniref:UPF0545 protein C22orf39 homolog isoform X2 n=1 Tax=Solea solea TaxID=90069 RepID=UPI00272D53D7|nr:UPF0545 protein C22orf39 homolog isoform X2 [Solea solea]
MALSGQRSWRPPRSCDNYWSEYKHCKSMGSRFNHYYTYGTFPSCQQWKEDYYSCKEWENHRRIEAKEALQTSERNRLAEQKKFTPVWRLRKDPPKDWNMPLNQEKPQDS